MNNIKIYIDKQTHERARLKPYRLRVMQGTSEAVAMYFENEAEAKRAKKFARKLVNGMGRVKDDG